MDDRDETIRNSVKTQLLQIWEDAIPFLEIAARDENLRRRSQAQIILKEIFPILLGEKFRRLSQKSGADLDLEEGICLLTQFGYPDFEPKIALSDNKDGLSFYKIFAKMAKSVMNENSCMIFEFGGDIQLHDIEIIFSDYNFDIYNDLQGDPRVIKIIL